MTVRNKKKEELEDKLLKINEREKQLKAQLKAIDAREREAARKKETRAKIILGGFLVSQLKRGNERYREIFDAALQEAPQKDIDLLLEYQNKISI